MKIDKSFNSFLFSIIVYLSLSVIIIFAIHVFCFFLGGFQSSPLPMRVKVNHSLTNFKIFSEYAELLQLVSIKCSHLLCKQAYKNFGNRVKTLKGKLEEKMKTLPEPSPVPSPTVDAPSPENSEDEDLGLPDAGTSGKSSIESQVNICVYLFKLNCTHDMLYVC